MKIYLRAPKYLLVVKKKKFKKCNYKLKNQKSTKVYSINIVLKLECASNPYL